MKILKTPGAFLTLALLVCVPIFAHAETALRISDSISIDVDQVVDGDFYGFAGFSGPVSISGTVNGDAQVIGSSITANGTITEDLFAIGGTVQVHASVTDDVRIVAGEATVAEHVGGDVFVLGGTLTVLSSASIDGNVFFYGGEGELNGAISGSVFGTSESLRIDGPVGGDVDVTAARRLVIGDRADIAGDLRYRSPSELTRAQNAVVVGDIVQNSMTTDDVEPREAFVPFLIFAFSTLIVFAVFRTRLQAFMHEATVSFTRNGLIGLIGIFALPVAVLLLVVTVIGSVIGLLGFLALVFLYILSFILIGIYLGVLLSRAVTKRGEVSLLWTVIGIIATELLFFIPFAGTIILLVLFAVMFGTLLSQIYQRIAV